MKKFSGLVMLLLLTLLVTLPIAASGHEPLNDSFIYNITNVNDSFCLETKLIVKEEVADIRVSETVTVYAVESIKPMVVGLSNTFNFI